MNQEAKQIMDKYPDFIQPMKGPQRTLMCFGFECDKGWYPLLNSLFEKIDKIVNPNIFIKVFRIIKGFILRKKLSYSGFEVIQVKEKFGGLRVYTNFSTDEIENLIGEAEKKADKTCEICGRPGCLCSNGGWLKTMCEGCMKGKEGYKKYEENTEECEGEK